MRQLGTALVLNLKNAFRRLKASTRRWFYLGLSLICGGAFIFVGWTACMPWGGFVPMQIDAQNSSSVMGAPILAEGTFLKVVNSRLALGTQFFNYPSINIFDLAGLYAQGRAADGHAKLVSAAAQGFRAVRFFAMGTYDESKIVYPAADLWQKSPDQYFAAMQVMITDARNLGVYLVPSLLTGVVDFSETSFGVCPNVFMLPMVAGSHNRQLTKEFMRQWAARFKNESGILFWEVGNELSLSAKERNPDDPKMCVNRQQIHDFIGEMVDTLHSTDGNHLIAGGATQEEEAGGLDDVEQIMKFYMNVPNVAFSTVHIYGNTAFYYDHARSQLAPIGEVLRRFESTAQSLGKALWVGEFGPYGAWTAKPFDNFVMSLLLAKSSFGIDLVTSWAWQTAQGAAADHPEFVSFSIDPANTDAVHALTQTTNAPGFPGDQKWQVMIGDFNGDGKSDVALYSDRGLWQVIPTGGVPAQWLAQYGDVHIDGGFQNAQAFAGDLDGDGVTDVGVKTRDGRVYVALSDRTQFAHLGQWSGNFGNETGTSDLGLKDSQVFVGDFNGDGKTDVGFHTHDGRWYVALSTGSALAPQALWIDGFGNDFSTSDIALSGAQMIAGDFNGDGKTDIGIRTLDGRWYVALSTGSSFAPPTLWLTQFGNQNVDAAFSKSKSHVIVGDFDGDRKADVALKTDDGRWYIALSTGQNFSGARSWITDFGSTSKDGGLTGAAVFAGDFNGDGRSDVGLRDPGGRVFLGINQGLQTNQILTSAWGSPLSASGPCPRLPWRAGGTP